MSTWDRRNETVGVFRDAKMRGGAFGAPSGHWWRRWLAMVRDAL